MTELATEAPVTGATDTPMPTPSTDARISEKDMDKLADKVSEAATPKSEAERAEKEAADLHALQVKAFRKAKDGRERADDGKYSKPAGDHEKDAAKALTNTAETAEKAPAKPDTKDQKPVADSKTAEASPETPAAKEVKYPQSWSPEKKAVWDTMSPEAREIVAKREQESHTAISKLGQFAKSVEPIARTLEAYKDSFSTKGLSYQEGVKQLLDAQRVLDRDPVEGIQAIAKSYGIDLGQSFAGQRDPAINQLQAQVDRLTQELEEARSERLTARQQETEKKTSAIDKAIADFSADKPDFAELEAEIAANIELIRENDPGLSYMDMLAKAYDRAAWANPASRQRLMAKQAKELEAQQLDRAKKAADEAKRMGAININSAAAPGGEIDLDSLQRQAYRRAANR